jgi:glyoxylase-like metal-dependent hydrolase (beta-lactamase superfamily II)
MRRKLTTVALAALICAAAAPLAAQQAQTKPETIRVGTTTEVWVLQESSGEGNTGVLIDAPADVVARWAPDGKFPNATNAVLVRNGELVTLIDTGYGRTIFEKMAALGIAPGDVDRVLLTHMHGDHIGGMLRDGARAFPNAKVALAQKEYDHWVEAGNAQALAIFEAYKGALEMLSPVEIDAAMGQGITPIAAYGHTPGHTVFMLRDGYEQSLVWGDLTHAMAIQMPHPEISVRYDSDPVAARDSRLKILRYVAAETIPVVGMHIPATAAGEVTASTPGYAFRVR